jgi:simple sugar transport system ATP-binding protein
MDDIFYVCDRVVALFHGANFAEARLSDTSRSQVIGWIMGTRESPGELAYDRVQ